MKGYKLASEGPHHYEIAHPDGSRFQVAKAGLSMAMHAQMAKLPKHMADGGFSGAEDPRPLASDVPADYESGDMMGGDSPAALQAKMINAANPSAPVPVPTDAPPSIAQLPVAAKPATPDQVPMQTAQNPNAQSPIQQPGTGGAPLPNAMGGFNKAFGELAGGAKTNRDAQQAAATEMGQIQQNYVKEAQAAAERRQAAEAQNIADGNKLAEDYANTKIDPGRVWSQASTGSKIAAGIGVLLSGIGSGLTGQKNMAMEVIHNTIQRDMEAQRADLGKKENLLTLNYRKYGNIQAAYNATMSNLYAVTQGQLAASGAKLQGAQASAIYQQAMGELDLKKMEYARQAGNTGVMVALGSGQGANQPINPEYLPPEAQKRAVPAPGGGVVLARAGSEAKDVRQSLTTLQTVESRIDDALKFATGVGRTVPGSDNSSVGVSKRDAIISSMGELNDLKRLNEQEFGMWKEMVPDPGSWRQGKALAQLQELKRLVAEKRNAIYQNETEGYAPGRSASRDVPLK